MPMPRHSGKTARSEMLTKGRALNVEKPRKQVASPTAFSPTCQENECRRMTSQPIDEATEDFRCQRSAVPHWVQRKRGRKCQDFVCVTRATQVRLENMDLVVCRLWRPAFLESHCLWQPHSLRHDVVTLSIFPPLKATSLPGGSERAKLVKHALPLP